MPPEASDIDGASARAALAAALDPVITIDIRGVILSASDSTERVLGWKPSELLGRNVSTLMPEPHHTGHDGYLANYQRTGRTNIMNRPRRFDALHRSGSLVPIELCVSEARVTDGRRLFVGIIRDVSALAAVERSREEDRVQSQQQLAEQTAALESAHMRLRMADRMASIGTLAAGLGHDMNNVLLPVRARINALRASGEKGRVQSAELRHVEEIGKSVAYLQQLADGLHFLALDPDLNSSRGEDASTSISDWWAQAGALLSKAVPKHARVMAEFDGDLPAVAIAPHSLTQAVLNLVVNAGEAIPPPSERKRREGRVQIAARLDSDGQHVLLTVVDNGRGMTEDVRRRAFEMFFTTKVRGLGTGLGLALVNRVVSSAGGRVEVESVLGKGTSVTLVIPVTRGSTSGRRVRAAVSVADGRCRALIRQILVAGGAQLESIEPADADIWIVESGAVTLKAAGAWRRTHPESRLVLVGHPRSAESEWRALRPMIVEPATDFHTLRATLGDALAGE